MILLHKPFRATSVLLMILIIYSCDPLVYKFPDSEAGDLYKSTGVITEPAAPDTLVVMTWNIRFGAARLPWFGDSCGDRVILTDEEVYSGLEGVRDLIMSVQPDIILLQEVDVESKRTAYIDQVQWLLDNTYFNYGAYASVWKAQVVPSDGLGRINAGNAILSRWNISDTERIQLPLRGDQDALTQYFYLRRCILKVQIDLPGLDDFYALDIHSSAFSTDDTKQKHILQYVEELQKLDDAGAYFVSGGDLNEIPANSNNTDFCLIDACEGETYHSGNPGDEGYHMDGKNYVPELTWLDDLYSNFAPAVKPAAFAVDQDQYYTHTPDYNGHWDRKLDYLFTSRQTDWVPGSDSTYQDNDYSDHVAVSARWEVPK